MLFSHESAVLDPYDRIYPIVPQLFRTLRNTDMYAGRVLPIDTSYRHSNLTRPRNLSSKSADSRMIEWHIPFDDDIALSPVALCHDLDEALLACDGVQTVGSAPFQMRRIGALEREPRVIIAICFRRVATSYTLTSWS